MKQAISSIQVDFQQMVNNALSAVWIVDQDKMIIWCNKSYLKLVNLPVEAILHKDLFQFIPKNIHRTFEKYLSKVFEKKEKIEPMEMKINKDGGETSEVEVMGAPYYLEGKIVAQVIFRDITRRKMDEKLLLDSEKLAALGQISAGFIHEIKNPLTVVKGFLQLLKESYSHSYLDTMENELNKALDTIQNLLQVSKPDLQNEPYVPIDVSEELYAMLSLFQDKLYSVKVEMDIRDSGVIITGKKNSILKAFFNIFKNAVEAIQGNGKLKIEHYLQDGWLQIKLSDTGVGIPPDKLKALGTPFYSTKTDGTGLGLTQVFSTISEHGGMIEVESTVGKGTTFHIQLPVK